MSENHMVPDQERRGEGEQISWWKIPCPSVLVRARRRRGRIQSRRYQHQGWKWQREWNNTSISQTENTKKNQRKISCCSSLSITLTIMSILCSLVSIEATSITDNTRVLFTSPFPSLDNLCVKTITTDPTCVPVATVNFKFDDQHAQEMDGPDEYGEYLACFSSSFVPDGAVLFSTSIYCKDLPNTLRTSVFPAYSRRLIPISEYETHATCEGVHTLWHTSGDVLLVNTEGYMISSSGETVALDMTYNRNGVAVMFAWVNGQQAQKPLTVTVTRPTWCVNGLSTDSIGWYFEEHKLIASTIAWGLLYSMLLASISLGYHEKAPFIVFFLSMSLFFAYIPCLNNSTYRQFLVVVNGATIMAITVLLAVIGRAIIPIRGRGKFQVPHKGFIINALTAVCTCLLFAFMCNILVNTF